MILTIFLILTKLTVIVALAGVLSLLLLSPSLLFIFCCQTWLSHSHIMALIQAALSDTFIQPSLETLVQFCASVPTLSPTNIITSLSTLLHVIGLDQSSLGTLVIAVVSIGISILVIVQSIAYWRSRLDKMESLHMDLKH